MYSYSAIRCSNAGPGSFQLGRSTRPQGSKCQLDALEPHGGDTGGSYTESIAVGPAPCYATPFPLTTFSGYPRELDQSRAGIAMYRKSGTAAPVGQPVQLPKPDA